MDLTTNGDDEFEEGKTALPDAQDVQAVLDRELVRYADAIERLAQ